jgi:hypothetical protein
MAGHIACGESALVGGSAFCDAVVARQARAAD